MNYVAKFFDARHMAGIERHLMTLHSLHTLHREGDGLG